MGFFDGLGRMIQGRPVFEDASSKTTTPPATPVGQQSSTHTAVDERGYKVIPQLRIEHCRSQIDGPAMTVVAWVTNLSSVEVELDKMYLLNTKTEIDRRLMPGASHEICFYKGPMPLNDHDKKAYLQYKIMQSDDYFQAHYMVEFTRQSTGMYCVDELHAEGPVQDI